MNKGVTRREMIAGREDAFKAAWLDTEQSLGAIARKFGISTQSATKLAKDFSLGRKNYTQERFQGGWTEERVELLKKLWPLGMPDSKLAKAIGGGLSRNAVVGKAHRLGLPKRGNAASAPGRAPRAPKAILVRHQAKVFGETNVPPVIAPTEAETAEPVVMSFRKEPPGLATMMTIGPCMCRWPIGDPRADDFTLCGKRTEPGATYCQPHHAIAYVAVQPKRKLSDRDVTPSRRRHVA